MKHSGNQNHLLFLIHSLNGGIITIDCNIIPHTAWAERKRDTKSKTQHEQKYYKCLNLCEKSFSIRSSRTWITSRNKKTQRVKQKSRKFIQAWNKNLCVKLFWITKRLFIKGNCFSFLFEVQLSFKKNLSEQWPNTLWFL